MDDELLILQEALKEVKYQFRIYLEGFDDIKKKSQILLIICSLFITLPLSSEHTLNRIILSPVFSILFFVGAGLLVISIVLLIIIMHDSRVKILEIDHLIDSIGKYDSKKILKAVLLNYRDNLKDNMDDRHQKLNLMDYSETFIILGMVVIFVSLILTI